METEIWPVIAISIHALLAESDRRPGQTAKANKDFYPRSPCGERHADTKNTSFHKLFLSTLSLRRATNSRANHIKRNKISIHALLAESDNSNFFQKKHPLTFLSTLSLRRATVIREPATRRHNEFLSTLSLRRATNASRHIKPVPLFLSTLSLRRATTR